MTKDPSPKAMQNFLVAAFPISAVRNMGKAGMLEIIRAFIRNEIDLASVSTNPSSFSKTLNDLTNKLAKRIGNKIPNPEQRWGVARKCLNLFFRDTLYNFYLRTEYDLEKLEKYLEIPLDRRVGERLKKCDEKNVPSWRSVKGLRESESKDYQAAAARIATQKDTERVHLDLEMWPLETNS